jgi:hypothetical protein
MVLRRFEHDSSSMPEGLMRRSPWIPTSLVFLCTPVLAQQVDVSSTLVGEPVQVGLATDLQLLESQFRVGDLSAARTTATALLTHAYCPPPSTSDPPPCLTSDLAKSVTIVVWPGTDGVGPTVLRRLTLPEPSSYPGSLDLPGLRPGRPPHLYEVFLALDERARLVSQYTFTREDDPILAQIPSVAEKLTGPLFGLLAAVGGPIRPAARTHVAALPLFATANRIAVPLERASIKVKSIALVPTTVERWSEEVHALALALRADEVSRSSAGRAFVNEMEKASVAVATDCRTSEASPPQCVEKFLLAFDRLYQSHTPAGLPADDHKAIGLADTKFRKFVLAAQPAKVERTLEVKNRPLTHFSLGLGTAVVFHGSIDKDRVKINDAGNLVADPLSRLLTMVVLNWSPGGYDADAPSPQFGERLRPFVAGIITPDPGVSIGGSVLLVRGLALTGGYGLIFTRGLRPGDEVGKPPSDTRDPLDFARAKVWYAGLSYNFK